MSLCSEAVSNSPGRETIGLPTHSAETGCAYSKSHRWPESASADGCESYVRARFSWSIERPAKLRRRLAIEKRVLSGLESAHLSRDRNCVEDRLASGCAPLVAVVKTAHLRNGNDRRQGRTPGVGSRFRGSLASEMSWMRDSTPRRTSRASNGRPR